MSVKTIRKVALQSGSFAVPGIILGSAAAAGVALTTIRSDGTIAAFDTTAPAAVDGAAAAVGTAAFAARRDHVHLLGPTITNALTLSAAGAALTLSSATGAILIGTNPATTGAIRLRNNAAIVARNVGNTADISLLGLDDSAPSAIELGASAGSVVRIGEVSQGATILRPSAGMEPLSDATAPFGSSTKRWTNGFFSNAVVIGTTPASQGSVRIPASGEIWIRNAGNTADLQVVALSGSNTLQLGASGAFANVTFGNASMTGRYGLSSAGFQVKTTLFSSGPQTLTATHNSVAVDATTGAITINLPSATGDDGIQYTIKKVDSSANAVTVDGAGAQTIDGAATYALSAQWKYVTIISRGGNWEIIANN